jgi:RNA polymerase sigma-70 factor (ECF subfamily)
MNGRESDPVDAAFRAEWGRVVAALIRRLRDWDLAEECAAEAFAEATRRWPREGVPDRPGAWLTTVAGHRAIDHLRRARRGGELLEQVGRDPGLAPRDHGMDELERIFDDAEAIPDDRLGLIFTCCHPALALEARVALTLRMLGGLSTSEIARAFLVEEAAMAKRLTRAKARIAGAGIPYRVPDAAALPERLDGVLAVLYLMFNEGYVSASGTDLLRVDLCEEAIRLARMLVSLMPQASEPAGLLALMLLHHSRRFARVDAAGELVTLEEQDRSEWDRDLIREGRASLAAALAAGEAGPYVLQAAIVACHAEARDAATTDWVQIAGLYAVLVEVMDTPVVRLPWRARWSAAWPSSRRSRSPGRWPGITCWRRPGPTCCVARAAGTRRRSSTPGRSPRRRPVRSGASSSANSSESIHKPHGATTGNPHRLGM